MREAGPPAGRRTRTRVLLEDGSLALEVDAALARLARPWVPRVPAARVADPAGALIRLFPGASPGPVPEREPEVQVLEMRGWMEDGSRMRLAGESGRVGGGLDLARGVAELRAPDPAGSPARDRSDVFAALTVAAAMLLGRRGRMLLHSAAFVGPDGGAWLLVGDSQSGKSSTCVTLIGAGLDYLSDDQVVVRADPETGEVRLEGWRRRFNLDDGFARGVPVGRRSPVRPARYGPGRWRRSAPLAGLLLPRVSAAEPTLLQPAHPAEALGQLIRQSPWLLADAQAAPATLALMSRMAGLPCWRLRLGLDAYGEPARLLACLAPALRQGGPGGRPPRPAAGKS